MAIPTWRNIAAPQLSTQDISRANANSVAAMDKMLGGFTDLDDTAADIMKTQATNALSNVTPNEGESRAASRERFVQANPDAFGSSYLDVDAMSGIEKSLSALDAGKKKISDENTIMGAVEQIEGINPMENPVEARTALNNIHTQNRLNNVSDPNKRLKYYSDQLLRNTPYTLSPDTIKRHGGIIGNESTYTPDVVAKVRKDITERIRKDNIGATEQQVETKVNQVFKESEYGAAFTRGIKYDESLTFKDRTFKKIAKDISDAPDVDTRIAAINKASRVFAENPQWNPEEADFLTQPIIRALDDMDYAYTNKDGTKTAGKVDPLKIWRQLQLGEDGNLKDQRTFLNKMYEVYRSKFTELPKKVIDQKIRQDIAENGTISAVIKAGNTIAELKSDAFRDTLSQWNKKSQETQKFFLDDRPVYSKAGDALLENLKKKYGNTEEWKALKADGIGELYKQVRIVSGKLKKAFTYPKGHPKAGQNTLESWQEDTFDLAVFRMLSHMGGYDPNTGFMNFKDPNFSITSIDPTSEMAKVDTNILMDELQRWLPANRDRTPNARKEIKKSKSASFDQRVNQYLQDNPPVHKVEMTDPGSGANVTYEQRRDFMREYAKSADSTDIRAMYFKMALFFKWEDPKGSVGEKMTKKAKQNITQLGKEFEELQRRDIAKGAAPFGNKR